MNEPLSIFKALKTHYPPLTTFLVHKNPFELLIAVILSAQCTDERVNAVTPALFKAFPNPETMSQGPLDKIKKHIQSVNFFNTKAANIQKTAHMLHTQYKDKVPNTLEALIELPGVGRKTANVVLGQAFGIPGITVDTHVNRVSRRLGFTKEKEAKKIEKNLMKVWPKETWIDFSSLLILHGRTFCKASNPKCSDCFLNTQCPKVNIQK